MANYKFILLFTLVCIATIVTANPDGAPGTACEDMLPNHGGTPGTPEEGNGLFSIEVINSTTGMDNFTVTLKSIDPEDIFKGFLVVAKNPNSGEIVGVFQNDTEESMPNITRIIDCEVGSTRIIHPSTGATHFNNSEKNLVTLQWSPNGYFGPVKFFTTYVVETTTYYVALGSDEITVEDPDATTTMEPEMTTTEPSTTTESTITTISSTTSESTSTSTSTTPSTTTSRTTISTTVTTVEPTTDSAGKNTGWSMMGALLALISTMMIKFL